MSITLGNSPDTLKVILTAGADFASTLTNSDGDWSPTCSIELRFDTDTTWAADIAGPVASFHADKADVDTLADSNARRVQLFYVDGTDDLCWAKGSVTRA